MLNSFRITTLASFVIYGAFYLAFVSFVWAAALHQSDKLQWILWGAINGFILNFSIGVAFLMEQSRREPLQYWRWAMSFRLGEAKFAFAALWLGFFVWLIRAIL